MKRNHNGKMTLGWRAHQAALRCTPNMGGDAQARQVLIDYFTIGYAQGWAAARRAKKPTASSVREGER